MSIPNQCREAAVSRELSMEDLYPLIQETVADGHSLRFSPKGTSMLPMLRQGVDSVVLSPCPETLKKYDLPLYRRENGQFVLHRVVGAGTAYTCMGDNQFTPEPGLRREQMIGLVTGFYRGEKFHSVEEPGYRLYCVFWHYSRPLRHFWCRGWGWLRRHLS